MEDGFELRSTAEKGEGIFATKDFKYDDLVMIGRIEKDLKTSHSHSSQIGLNRHVLHGGLISKVNHSCDPNCGIHLNESGGHDFHARKAIKKNDEITFDYAMRNFTVNFFPTNCQCGSKNCRGKITGWNSLTKEKKKEYKGFVAPYLLDIDGEFEI